MGNYNRNEKSGHGRRDSGKREMHKAVCDNCSRDCEVPFVPTSGKPIYCSDCFERKEGGSSRSRNYHDRGSRGSRFERRGNAGPNNREQFAEINRKLDKLLEILTPAPLTEEEVLTKKKEVILAALKKIKEPKKEKPDKKK